MRLAVVQTAIDGLMEHHRCSERVDARAYPRKTRRHMPGVRPDADAATESAGAGREPRGQSIESRPTDGDGCHEYHRSLVPVRHSGMPAQREPDGGDHCRQHAQHTGSRRGEHERQRHQHG